MKKLASMILALALVLTLATATFGTTTEELNSVIASFEKYYSNKMIVLAVSDKVAVGTTFEVTIKRDLTGLDTATLVFYNYSKRDNLATQNNAPKYKVDAEGKLTFTIDSNQGYVIITDGLLAKRTAPLGPTKAVSPAKETPTPGKTTITEKKEPVAAYDPVKAEQANLPNYGDSSGTAGATEAGQGTGGYGKEVMALINNQRRAAGLGEVTWSDDFATCANIRAEEMSRKFGHTRPEAPKDTAKKWPSNVNSNTPYNAPSVADELGIPYQWVMENAATGQKTPTAVMNSWMKSSGHSSNILLADHTICGVGYYVKNGITYWALWLD